MSDFLTNLSTLSTFFINELGAIANFFLTNNLCLLIIGVALFSVILSLFTYLLDKFKR